MNKASIAVLVSLFAVAASAQAQTRSSQDLSPSTEIRESTDPSKVAEVERRAAEIMSNQQSSGMSATSGSSDSSVGNRGMGERKQGSKAKRSTSQDKEAGSR